MTDHIFDGGKDEASAADHHPQQLSDLLRGLSLRAGPRISIRDIAAALADRSFGAFLVIFALPNLVPLPPGATLIVGLPLIFVSWQMAFGARSRIWLPDRVANYSFDRATFAALVRRIGPWLKRAETLVRPRYWFIGNRTVERLLGLFALVVAIVCALPIPLGNWLPAFALAIIGFAHTERDGLGLAVGIVVGVVSVAIAGFVVLTAGALLSLAF